MADGRRARVWGLIAERAGMRAAVVSAVDACEAAAAVAGADGAWLAVMSDPGHRELVHATDRTAAGLEELQFTLGEGPCPDAFTSGAPVLVPDLATANVRTRWPGLTAAGQLTGAAALFAFPLAQGAIRAGVLGLYRATRGPLTPAALADVLVCADMALLLLLESQSGTDRHPDWPGHAGGDAPRGAHTRVYQATGMISVQRGVGLEAALALLRAYAFAHDLPLGEVAARVVDRRLRLDAGAAGDAAG